MIINKCAQSKIDWLRQYMDALDGRLGRPIDVTLKLRAYQTESVTNTGRHCAIRAIEDVLSAFADGFPLETVPRDTQGLHMNSWSQLPVEYSLKVDEGRYGYFRQQFDRKLEYMIGYMKGNCYSSEIFAAGKLDSLEDNPIALQACYYKDQYRGPNAFVMGLVWDGPRRLEDLTQDYIRKMPREYQYWTTHS